MDARDPEETRRHRWRLLLGGAAHRRLPLTLPLPLAAYA